MIVWSGRKAVEPAFSVALAALLPLPKMGRSAYWKGPADSLASFALGDANRGAFLALQSAVSTRRRLVATDPPERRASSLFGRGSGLGQAVVLWRSGETRSRLRAPQVLVLERCRDTSC